MAIQAFLLNGKLILAILILLSLLMVRRFGVPRGRKVKAKDLFLLGHVFVISLALYGIYSYCLLQVSFHENRRAFNSPSWQANREKRIEMLDDLVDRELLSSKDSNTVIGMLGHPVRIIRDSTRSALEFYTGFRQAPFQADPTFLFVEITKGTVTDFYVIPGIPDIQ